MRRTIGLLLASGLAMLVAGCASTGGGGGTTAGATAATGGGTAAPTESMRNFNLRVKCPGVHTLKLHGWTDQQIQAQLSVEPDDIAACEKWVAEQPKGYVPPPPAGVTPKRVQLPAAQAAPAASNGSAAAAPAPAKQ